VGAQAGIGLATGGEAQKGVTWTTNTKLTTAWIDLCASGSENHHDGLRWNLHAPYSLKNIAGAGKSFGPGAADPAKSL
jgi:hypothetical protein